MSNNAISRAFAVVSRSHVEIRPIAAREDVARRVRVARHLEHVAGYILGAMRYPKVMRELRVMPGTFMQRCRRVISAHTDRDSGRWAVVLDILAEHGDQAARDFAATLT